MDEAHDDRMILESAFAAEIARLLGEPATAADQRAAFATIVATLRPTEGTPSDAAACEVLRLC